MGIGRADKSVEKSLDAADTSVLAQVRRATDFHQLSRAERPSQQAPKFPPRKTVCLGRDYGAEIGSASHLFRSGFRSLRP